MLKKIVAVALAAALTGPMIASDNPAKAAEECPASAAKKASRPAWPPLPKKGEVDVVHFGEGHWNEGQGPLTMPILVQDLLRYDPEMVLFSADIADIGTFDRLACWRQIIRPSTKRGTPWFNSPGNHDRVALAGPGGVVAGEIDIWRQVFADMSMPWGDSEPWDPRIVLPEGEPDDGEGAATHYYFDYRLGGRTPALRVVVLDNSQQGLTTSDEDQYPQVGPSARDASQLAFLERVAAEADELGLITWVVMHQPTQDPRDVSNVNPVSFNHTMGKGLSADNQTFDAIAQLTGIDAVFLGHIQGNALYSVGGTRYYIDGGGGGSPYALRETGTDTGYYYGYRVLRMARVDGEWVLRTYMVPLIDRIEIEAPKTVTLGEEVELEATAIQPYDPDLPPRLGLTPNEAIRLELRAPETSPGFESSVPLLAYMWKSLNPEVLKPAAPAEGTSGDPSFDARTMTSEGIFEAVKPGVARVAIMSGTHTRIVKVRVVP